MSSIEGIYWLIMADQLSMKVQRLLMHSKVRANTLENCCKDLPIRWLSLVCPTWSDSQVSNDSCFTTAWHRAWAIHVELDAFEKLTWKTGSIEVATHCKTEKKGLRKKGKIRISLRSARMIKPVAYLQIAASHFLILRKKKTQKQLQCLSLNVQSFGLLFPYSSPRGTVSSSLREPDSSSSYALALASTPRQRSATSR